MVVSVLTLKDLSSIFTKNETSFALASSEVKKTGSQKVGTEHILMSLLKDESIMATRIMINLGISLSKARQVLKQKMGLAGDSAGKGMNRRRNVNVYKINGKHRKEHLR